MIELPLPDEYTLRARIAPATIAAIPFVAFLIYIPSAGWIAGILPALGVLGALIAAGDYVWDRGKAVESRLTSAWNGFPTTRLLRTRTADVPLELALRRGNVERLAGRPLPSAEDEQYNPADSDTRIQAAVRTAIAEIRRADVAGKLLHEHNIGYGFRRNSRGIRTAALIVIGLALVLNAIALAVTSTTLWFWIVLGIQLVCGLYWLFQVNDRKVRQAAESYSDQFFIAAQVTVRHL